MRVCAPAAAACWCCPDVENLRTAPPPLHQGEPRAHAHARGTHPAMNPAVRSVTGVPLIGQRRGQQRTQTFASMHARRGSEVSTAWAPPPYQMPHTSRAGSAGASGARANHGGYGFSSVNAGGHGSINGSRNGAAHSNAAMTPWRGATPFDSMSSSMNGSVTRGGGASSSGSASSSGGASRNAAGYGSTTSDASSGAHSAPAGDGKTGTRRPFAFGDAATRVACGLFNQGNTCFFNALVQALVHAPRFFKWLRRHVMSCTDGLDASCFACAIGRTAEAMFRKGRVNAAFRPQMLYDYVLRRSAGRLHRFRQEDAHEAFTTLLNGLEVCCCPVGWKLPPNSASATTPHKAVFPDAACTVFKGDLRSRVTCTRCERSSDTFDPFEHISLELASGQTGFGGRSMSVLRLLQHFVRRETLDGEDAYTCEHCREKVRATKALRMAHVPDVFVLHLKRFRFTHAHATKITSHVDFTSCIDVAPFVARDTVRIVCTGDGTT